VPASRLCLHAAGANDSRTLAAALAEFRARLDALANDDRLPPYLRRASHHA